ncbi:hypothetical protein A1D24_11575 [Testudinibacter aquarius]|uniref:Uncharacterized protein n=1 Tax=Testudinibacter aquarius TaxID=1524974 RepID=A0A4R3YEL1_9PAST|nr:hypothetical protein A1D24_11575 [Testudinibacter aquarius]TCV88903.1 hypothetical protein EDC16_103262 [Testudinibacter aquarius]
MQTRSFNNNRTFVANKTVMRSLHNLLSLLLSDQQISSASGDFFCPQFSSATLRTIRLIPILTANLWSNRNATRSYV